MSHTANESDKIMVPKEQIDSPSLDEGSCGGSLGGGGAALKKGPWTSAEDSILVDYVKKHGEGNWNAVQKHSGLSRCGKSCRLRWANHLRPNLKKGAFTPEEEQLIIELHARMGNKWARMAAHLPGRTDNEIKNYWNTRIKRRQRAGLPLYPQNMALPPSSENQQGQALCEFSSGDKRHNEVLQANSYDIPDVIFDNYKVSPGVLAYAPPFPDISMGGMLSQGLGSQTYSFINPSMSRGKRLRESESLFPRYHGSITGALSTFDQFLGEPPEKTQRAFGSSYPFDPPDPCSKSLVPFEGAVPGSHATLNGNNPPSNPSLGHEELPSLQFSKDLNSWFPCFSSTPLEALDHYIQSPPATASIQSDLASPRNSGLLEDLLHEAQALRNGKKHSTEKSSTSSAVTPSDVVESSTLNLCESGGWEDYNDDPISPLGCSAASVFNECTPPISGSSLDEIPPSRGANSAGSEILMPSGEHGSTPNMVQSHISQRSDFLRPDVMLGADWHLDSSQTSKDHTEMNNALATLLGDDFREQKPLLDDDFREQKPMIVDTSSFTQRLGLDFYPWNNMPRACQMSEYP